MTYGEKLKDPRWQKKRLEILERDDWTCQGCWATEKTLHVHHLAYTNNPWDAEAEDLMTLCDSCHDRLHKNKADYQRVMAEFGASLDENDLQNLKQCVCGSGLEACRILKALAFITHDDQHLSLIEGLIEIKAAGYRRGQRSRGDTNA